MAKNGDDFYANFAKVLDGTDAARMQPWLEDEKHLTRFAVHQGNYRMTTSKAMQGIYKAVFRLVGDEYFMGLMTQFLHDYPPQSSSLTHYGADFPAFLRNFSPVQKDLPWLAPVAQLDWAWFCAYGAKNTPALDASDLLDVAPELLPGRTPGLHTSCTLLRFSVPAYSIWRTNREDKNVGSISMKKGREWACVWRQDMTIRHASLNQAEYAFLDAIGGGRILAEAWTDARLHEQNFNLSKQFARWLNAGIFMGDNND